MDDRVTVYVLARWARAEDHFVRRTKDGDYLFVTDALRLSKDPFRARWFDSSAQAHAALALLPPRLAAQGFEVVTSNIARVEL